MQRLNKAIQMLRMFKYGQSIAHPSFINILFLALLFSCGEKKSKGSASESSIANKNPNIIIVFTDDQGYGDLGYHGNPYLKTPNLDEFAAASLELTDFHVGTTCAPSRAGLMTGRNANRNNAWHTIAGCSILLEDEETMAQVFERNGYRTAMFGKWHLGDNYPFRPHDRGFQNAFYHGGGGVNQTPDYWNNTYFDDTYFRNGKPEKTEGYCTDVWFDEAIGYIGKTEEEPFLLYLAPNAAHSPFNVPEKYAKMYADTPLTDAQKRFYGMVTNIDDNFGKLVSYLQRTGKFENTILIFATDNGTDRGISVNADGEAVGFNAGLRGKKGSHYDGGHRVPFFISWPKGDILQKQKIEELTAHVDLLPTLADLAGIDFKPKKPLDGTNMATIFRGKEKNKERMLVIDTQRNQWPEKGRNPCVMSTGWRLVNGNELYYTANDPGQENDIAEKHPEIVKKMQAFYDDWWSDIQSGIRYAEIPLGDATANPATITVHDMHTEGAIPWNQVQIRKGEYFPEGYYSINVVEDGQYEFRLYRYPPESALALNAEAVQIQGTSYRDELPVGRVLKPVKASVMLGENKLQAEVDANGAFASLQGNLKKGSYELKAEFFSEDGVRIPAYYLQIEKL
jgi:arylsulfatase A-like enzyme